jgi:hypothetical protein
MNPLNLTGDDEMGRFDAVLLDVWRECCRHIDIEESLATGAGLLAERLPFEWLLIVGSMRRAACSRRSRPRAAVRARRSSSRAVR